jgi:hypothetical protein
MEYRETPRMPATEERIDGVIDDVPPRPRLRRFEFVRSERHLDMTRVVLVGGALLAALSLLAYLGVQGIQGSIRWVQEQPQYQVKFQDIQLAAPPPAWLRGGAEGLLKQVREASGEAEILRIFEIKHGAKIEENPIARDFLESPWVQEVKRIEYPPYGIRVHLGYKTPVAVLSYARGEQILLDRAGTILPLDDVETSKLGPVIKIVGGGLAPSAENQAGKRWKSAVAGAAGARLERAVGDAARLAGFLLAPERAGEAAACPALRVLSVIATDGQGKPDDRGLFVLNAEAAVILWGNPPGTENGTGPDEEEKWKILRKWAKGTQARALSPGDYWAFRKGELKAVNTH